MAAQCRLRVTQALPFSYRMLGGGSPQLSWREAGVRTGLLLSEAPSWGYTRAQPERDSGSVCRLLSPAHEGSCGQHRQNLLGDCSFLFPKTSLDVVRVPSPLFTRCRISSRALQPLCVCVLQRSLFSLSALAKFYTIFVLIAFCYFTLFLFFIGPKIIYKCMHAYLFMITFP